MTGVPDHLRDLFLARLHGVGEPAVRAASVVAVMGDQYDERLVADAIGNRPDRSVLTITADMPGLDGPLDSRPVAESARKIKQLVESER